MRSYRSFGVGSALVLAAACGVSDPTTATRTLTPDAARFSASGSDAAGVAYSPELAAMNDALRASGTTGYAVAYAELLTDTSGMATATTLIANDRTHLVSVQFVPSDPRRGGSSAISYLVDQSDGAALGWDPTGNVAVVPNSVTEPAIDASMATWRDAPRCGAPEITKVADTGADPDLADGLVLGNPALIGTPRADITFGGWLSSTFFNRLAKDGASFILGVTLTFNFIDDDRNPTDIDHDGFADAAFREIYFNRSFPWGDDLRPVNVDLESVIVHEAGHAYGLGHFGKVFIDNKGTLKYSPKAIMNAVYVSPFRTLTGTDNASFCQAWANAH
jgi:hypothetical protein